MGDYSQVNNKYEYETWLNSSPLLRKSAKD